MLGTDEEGPVRVDRRAAAEQQRIADALGETGFALPGSLTVRAYRCGKANCRCRGEPPRLHGPYAFWTRKVEGKTVSRILSSDELAELKPWFDNARRLRDLVAELQQLSLALVETARTGRSRTPPTPSRGRTRPPRAQPTPR